MHDLYKIYSVVCIVIILWDVRGRSHGKNLVNKDILFQYKSQEVARELYRQIVEIKFSISFIINKN